jgi:hypothetical protein
MSLKDKLDQAERDRELAIFNADAEISSIKAKIADSEVTYSAGDRFRDNSNGKKHILIFACNSASMIDLKDGYSWVSGVKIDSIRSLKPSEMDLLYGCHTFTRYWDARKQCKC